MLLSGVGGGEGQPTERDCLHGPTEGSLSWFHVFVAQLVGLIEIGSCYIAQAGLEHLASVSQMQRLHCTPHSSQLLFTFDC